MTSCFSRTILLSRSLDVLRCWCTPEVTEFRDWVIATGAVHTVFEGKQAAMLLHQRLDV